ncbi:hypothetical protein [Variovorax sp.]|jgi:hypothetical protein|uniref:hypothetical protein n=1 Tax=Variovorax sp. TaxID=1871043 RepID=UPI001214D72B|nr:hypothetical protein [Variovorax sp.]TAJ58999.1 MAG: hypothetical protein EPO53_32730 [Variovorax sp.]
MKLVVPAKATYHIDDSWWRLLQDEDDALYVIVDCEASFVSYQCLIKLNDYELRDYHGLGWLAIQHLANRINYFADEYKDRRLVGSALASAIEASR